MDSQDWIYSICRFVRFDAGNVIFRKMSKGKNVPDIVIRLPFQCSFLQRIKGDYFSYEDYLNWCSEQAMDGGC